ncbi:DNA polymerase III subunit alpha [Phragmitibacter flavus]|uniref:DNA-directed DNA polymerase n=1 Tax=Phragmitibacter flavus TaxID=2576071 RepID=A0A5R8KAT4_9BACT|nr:error-prone DNA polymerase [Phragmitibacter flavus]TLD69422.1 DNA polymerase III subunit alpha [Phragmitibacter flavus]
MAFVELHARSAFSFLRGSSSPEALVTRAAELGMGQMAVCDRDGVYGSARVHHKAGELGLRGLVGAELTMEDVTVLPVLVRTREGYQHLCRLLTRAKLRAAKGESRVLWDELAEHAGGLLALSGDEEGPLARAMIGKDGKGDAPGVVEKLVRIFGRDHVAVEVQRHRLRKDKKRVDGLVELAERFGVPLMASNGVCYSRMNGRLLLDAFSCLRHHTTLDEAGLILAANSQRGLKSEAQMRELFADLPQAVDNTQRVADLLEFTLEDLGYEFPSYQVPEGHDMASYLREVTYAGAGRRFPDVSEKVRRQLDKELALITKLGFSGYFLVIWDLVNFCRDEGILVQGRGSAANSAVCYSLSITNADPIAGQLLFERFLSEGRKTWPDIDLDLPSGEKRERVIQEVYRRFAPHGAAMTANVITYRGKSAMREMGKVLGLTPDVLSRFSDLFGHGDFAHTLELKDHLKRSGLPDGHPRLPALLKLYQAAYGLPRHLGQHSGGMVLCSQGLDGIVPLEPASMPGRVVVQWDKDDCEDLGIIKVDLLGLGMMAVIEETLATCRARGEARTVELHRIPADDEKTYAMIQRADTVGVFQIESRAQMATLPRLKPKCFYDIVIATAIIRPGPIVGKMVHPFLNRRAGKEKVDYIADCFEPVLKRTLGIPLFQEQMLSMAMTVAGFSGSEAEELRRALSFHRSQDRMQKVMVKLRVAMDERRVDSHVQERIVQSIQSFAVYGFPESHAISFALLAYASAWLRAHRLAELTAALLNNQPMGFYSSSTLVSDARHHGLRVLPVCVVESAYACEVVDDETIRLGLKMLRGFSRKSAERLLMERSRMAWGSLDDLLLRCSLPRDERRVLAKAGALNALAGHRRSALWEVEREREVDLFSWKQREAEASVSNVLEAMTPEERLEADYQAVALTVGVHPMRLMRASLPGVRRAIELPRGQHGQLVTIAGLVICRQRPGTANGHVFISLEDETGIGNAFVPSALFEAQRLVINQESFLKIQGRLQIVDEVTSVYALRVEALVFESEVTAKSHDFK